MIISPCAVFDCNTCEHLAAERCPGCRAGNDDLSSSGTAPCNIYSCTLEQGIETCNDCSKPSCEFSRGTDTICPLRAKLENRRWWAGKIARALGERGTHPVIEEEKISDRTIDRMRWYLSALDSFVEEGASSLSSWQLAQKVGVKAALIRKDLSRFGEFGTPSLGYDAKYLRGKILDVLKLNETRHVMWIGAQKLREHRPALDKVCAHNCHLVAVLDPDPSEMGLRIGDVQVLGLDSLQQVLSNLEIDLAVIAIPAPEAQQIANAVVRSGVTAILNMSQSLLTLPGHVAVRNVDVGGELLALSYYCGRTSGDGEK